MKTSQKIISKNIFKDRLLKLAKHLEKGVLGHEVFDFSHYNLYNVNHTIDDTATCGTNGCAIGECPIVFPKDWKFDGTSGFPRLIKKTKLLFSDTLEEGSLFFGLTGQEYKHLFWPDAQHPYKYGGKDLYGNATKEEVASNIREFVKIKYPKVKK